MAYLYSLALRVTDNVMAPIKVAICKSRDVLTQHNMQNLINLEPEKVQLNDEENINHMLETIVNVDGIDSQTVTKKMERLYPTTGFFTSYMHFFSDPTHVYTGLYLGSAYNAACWYTLEKFGIKYIINVTTEIDNYHEQYGITYFKIPIRDDNNESIQIYLEESYNKIDEFLNKKNGNVLVHCYMGASRSATIVANYIAKKSDTDVTDVITNLIERRPVVNPTQQLVADLINTKV